MLKAALRPSESLSSKSRSQSFVIANTHSKSVSISCSASDPPPFLDPENTSCPTSVLLSHSSFAPLTTTPMGQFRLSPANTPDAIESSAKLLRCGLLTPFQSQMMRKPKLPNSTQLVGRKIRHSKSPTMTSQQFFRRIVR